jgi:hypothetical protein
MRAATSRPHAKLVSIKQAEAEFGLPAALIRELIHRGELAAIEPPGIRRVFLVRADLERKFEAWRVR